jgi:serine protease
MVRRAALLLLFLCVLPLAARAGSDPAKAARTCQASQLKASGAFMKSNFRCWSTFFKKLDQDKLFACFDKADAKFIKSWHKAITKAGAGICSNELPPQDLMPGMAREVDDLVGLVSDNRDDSFKAERTLHSRLHKVIGTAFGKSLAAQSKTAKTQKDTGKSQKAIDAVHRGFAKALAKAIKQGGFYFGADSQVVTGEMERIVDEFVGTTGGLRHSVRGEIQIAAATFVDSDVNDTNTEPVPNDDPADAQQIVVPVTIGGYVNTPFTGPGGHTFESGDGSDAYRASIREGQIITLLIGGDPDFIDIDFCLFEVGDTNNPVDCSLGTGNREELVVPFDGEFFIQVFPYEFCDCASPYMLIIGQDLAGAGGDTGLRLSDEFVPGQVIVAPKQGEVRAASAAGFAASLGMQALSGAPSREMLLGIPAKAAAASAAAPAKDAGFPKLSTLGGQKLETILAVKSLRARNDVETADLNYVLRRQVVPNDEFVGFQWHYPLINLPAAWDITTGSASVKVAVVDTGVVLSHPDLQGQLGQGYDFISDTFSAADGGGIDDDPDDPGDGFDRPSSFHGTHVAGTIGAASNNRQGVAGVAWNVELIPVRVLGRLGGTSFDVIQGVRFAAGLANNSGKSNKADVINLSLGGGGFSTTDENVYKAAAQAGVIVVAAAGNENSSRPSYPAAYQGVVSVSAVDPQKRRAPYSNFGAEVDVAAPGGDLSTDSNGDGYGDGVLSTGADDSAVLRRTNYVFYQGTSMAAPHVAGVAALMKSVNPSLDPAAFDALLASGTITQDLGASGRDDVFGHGLIDARKAVVAAAGVGEGDPIPVVTPTSINFGILAGVQTFSVLNAGGGDLEVTNISDDSGGWLDVVADPNAVDAEGFGTYRLNADRSGLTPGTWTATVTIETSTAPLQIAVVPSRRRTAPTPSTSRACALARTCSSPAPTPPTTASSATPVKPAAPTRPSTSTSPSSSTATSPASPLPPPSAPASRPPAAA